MTEGDTPSSQGTSPPSSATAWSPSDPNRPALFPPTPASNLATNPSANMTAPGGVVLTDAQFQQLLGTLTSQSTAATSTAPGKPRVGGASPVGYWTGNGAQNLGMQPASGNCMRYFKGNELKAFQALQSVEDKCKAGLQAKGTLAFGLQGETHFDKGDLLLRELDECLTYNGLEGVFHIVSSDGTTIH
jgi:hypothetical protein